MDSTYEKKPSVIYEATVKHENTLIILHGRGMLPEHLASPLMKMNVPQLSAPFSVITSHMKLVYPRAGLRVYHPYWDNQWFEIEGPEDFEMTQKCHAKGHKVHTQQIKEIIEEEVRLGIPPEKIGLIGISQGCAQALFSGVVMDLSELGGSGKLGAVVGLCGWLTYADKIKPVFESKKEGIETLSEVCEMVGLPRLPKDSKNLEIPVWLGYGLDDEAVKLEFMQTARDTLSMLGMSVELQTYEGLGHMMNEKETGDMLTFLEKTIGLYLPKGTA